MERRNHFTLLRLALAAGVIASHAYELVDGNRTREPLTRLGSSLSLGEIAVDGFFLLSGTLLAQSWHRSPQLSSYLRKRILRIFPAFIVATCIGALVVGPLGAGERDYWSQFSLTQLFTDALTLRPTQTPPVFVGLPHPEVNGAMWTIRYEFALYLAVPLLLWRRTWRHSLWLIATVSAIGLHCFDHLVPLATLSEIPPLLARHVPLLARLATCFLIGGGFFFWRDRLPSSRRFLICAALLIVLALPHRPLAEPVLALCGGFLLLRFAYQPIAALQRTQSWPDVSYGLYLYGWPIQQLLHWHFPRIPALGLLGATLTLGVFAGWLSWHLVEKPALAWRPTRHQPKDAVLDAS